MHLHEAYEKVHFENRKVDDGFRQRIATMMGDELTRVSF